MTVVQTQNAVQTPIKDKGVKTWFEHRFAELYPKWAQGDVEGAYRGTQAKRNMEFRRDVCWPAVELGLIEKIENAAGHYNAAKLGYEAKFPGSTTAKGLGRAEGKNNGGRKPGKVVAASTAATALQLGWNGSPAAAYIDAEVAALKEQKFIEAVQAAEANAEEVPVPQSAETVVQEAPAETATADVTDVVAKPSKNKGKKAN